MPQRRKQQKGAGLFDILSSDPAKKIEANNKRIEELEKESEKKCAELKTKIDIQIGDLKKKNEELQKAVDEKKAADVKESAADAEQASSGFSFSKITNLFGSKGAEAPKDTEALKGAEALKPAPKPEEEVNPAPKQDVFAAGDRKFGGKKSKRRRGSKARKSAKK